MSYAWAMKSTAKVQYIIEPSRLNEYPIGMTKLEILRLTPKRSSASRIFGYAASELAVANESRNASLISTSSLNTRGPRKTKPAATRIAQSRIRPM